MRAVGFVILTWNSENYIQDCLRAILSIDDAVFHGTVIVVDNGSEDGTVDRIRSECKNFGRSVHKCELVTLDKNYGTTRSRNLGLRKLLELSPDTQYVCILDSDAEISAEALKTLTDVLDKDTSVGIVGPRMHDAAGVYQVSGKNFSTVTEKFCKVMPVRRLREYGERREKIIPAQGTGIRPVGYLMSACWMARRAVIDELGPLDEKIFYAPEDLEYCIRCWKAGYRVVYCYDADVLHHWQRLSRKKLFSRHNYEHIKGLIYVFMKYRYCLSAGKLWRSIGQNAGSEGETPEGY